MSARTDALVSRSETGKMTASIVPIVAGCHPARALTNVFVLIWFHPSGRGLTKVMMETPWAALVCATRKAPHLRKPLMSSQQDDEQN
jgi:hypothetical protein